MSVFWAVLTQVTTLIADKAICKFRTAIFNGLRTVGKGMTLASTIITVFFITGVAFIWAILETVSTLSAKQADLVFFPLGFLRTELGDVVLSFANEAALSRFHAWDSERMLSQFCVVVFIVFVGLFSSFGFESLSLLRLFAIVGVFGRSWFGFR